MRLRSDWKNVVAFFCPYADINHISATVNVPNVPRWIIRCPLLPAGTNTNILRKARRSRNKSFGRAFSKARRFPKGSALGLRSAERKISCGRSSAGVNPIKRSGGSFFGEGRPAIEGAPKWIAQQFTNCRSCLSC